MASGALAGESLQASRLAFPAATLTTIPALEADVMAVLSGVFFPPPKLMEITIGVFGSASFCSMIHSIPEMIAA